MINIENNVNKRFKFGVHTKHILKTMCGIINVNVEDVNFNKPDWQDEYSWSFVIEFKEKMGSVIRNGAEVSVH